MKSRICCRKVYAYGSWRASLRLPSTSRNSTIWKKFWLTLSSVRIGRMLQCIRWHSLVPNWTKWKGIMWFFLNAGLRSINSKVSFNVVPTSSQLRWLNYRSWFVFGELKQFRERGMSSGLSTYPEAVACGESSLNQISHSKIFFFTARGESLNMGKAQHLEVNCLKTQNFNFVWISKVFPVFWKVEWKKRKICLRMYHHSFHQEPERSYFYNHSLEIKLRNKLNQKLKMNKIL